MTRPSGSGFEKFYGFVGAETNQWYPDRLNTARLGFIQGSVTLGFDLVSNLGAEFWPDVKRKLRRK